MTHTNQDKQPKNHKGSFRFLKILGICIYGLLLIIMLSWGIFVQIYKNKFFPNVHVLGINVGGLTKDQALKQIEKKIREVKTKEIEIKTESSQTQTKFEDIGAEIYSDDVIIELTKYGRSKNLVLQFKELIGLRKKVSVDPKIEINKTEFDNFLTTFVQNNTSEVVQPQLLSSNGQISIKEGTAGTVINQDKLKKDLAERIAKNHSSVIHVETQLVQPEDSKSTKYQTAKKAAENMIDKSITLIYNDQSYNVGSKLISSWIVFDQTKNPIVVSYSDAGISGWISQIAKNIDVAPKATVLNYKGETISQGEEGLALDRDDAWSNLRSLLRSNNKQANLNLKTKPVPAPIERQTSNEGPNIGMSDGKYIEIDISQQTMYLIEGTTFINAFRVSTGKSTMPTPIGTFSILNKNARAYSAKYGLYMPYWNAITNQGHGIHELPEWPNGYKEGESHLGIPVSHGCIRLGVGPAAYVFYWAPIGTPVFIHS